MQSMQHMHHIVASYDVKTHDERATFERLSSVSGYHEVRQT